MSHGTKFAYYAGCRCDRCLLLSTKAGRLDVVAEQMRNKNARYVRIRKTMRARYQRTTEIIEPASIQ